MEILCIRPLKLTNKKTLTVAKNTKKTKRKIKQPDLSGIDILRNTPSHHIARFFFSSFEFFFPGISWHFPHWTYVHTYVCMYITGEMFSSLRVIP